MRQHFSTDIHSHHHHPSKQINLPGRFPRSSAIRTTVKDHLKRLSESEALVKTSRLLQRWTSKRSDDIQSRRKPQSNSDPSQRRSGPIQSNRQPTRLFKNESSFIKIIRFEDTILGFQERVVFPGQMVFLNLEDHALVRIKSNEHVTSVNVDTIHGGQLPLADFEQGG